MAENKNQTLREARKVMDFLTGGDELKRLREKWAFDRAMDLKAARMEGEKRGERKGKKEAQIEMAEKMLARGRSVEEIMEITELTKEEVEELENN